MPTGMNTLTASNVVPLTGRSPSDKYSIRNIYMGMVFHKTLSPELGLYN